MTNEIETTYKWKVVYEKRVKYVYASTLEEAVRVASDRVRPDVGDLQLVECYIRGEGWGMCYVAPRRSHDNQ